jgi:hypothetical protein
MANLRALQDVELERFWQEFETVMGDPEGLMTYRYLGTHAVARDRHTAEGWMVLRSDLRSAHGLQAAPLMILVADVVGILDDAIAVPAPVEMDLLVLDDGAGVERVYCYGDIYHEGRTLLFSRGRLVDAADHARVLAVCRDIGVVIAPAPEGYRYVDPGPGVPESPSLPPLWQAFGAVERPGGELAIPALTSRLGSTSASLHHGPTQVVLEAAATNAAMAALRTDAVRVRHWHVTFTARGTTGPFVTSTTVVTARADSAVVEALLVEEDSGRRLALATAVFDRV